jgi:mRNA interferase MazF
MKKGDIVLVSFPFTDLTGVKNRPALVIAASELDAIRIFFTNQLKWQDPFDVVFVPSAENGLKKESLLRVSKIATIDRNKIPGRLGKASSSEIEAINVNLKKLLQIN